MKPTNNSSLWAIIQNIATKNSEWAKQYPDLRECKEVELKINRIKSRCVKDMVKVSSFLIKKDPTLTLGRLTRTFWKIHAKQNNKNREYLLKRFNRFRKDIGKAPKGLVPFMISLELLFLTDLFPEIIQNKQKISNKLSESAFGSQLYDGTIKSSLDN